MTISRLLTKSYRFLVKNEKKLLFAFLGFWIFLFILSLTEVFIYPGFVKNHFHLNLSLLLIPTFGLGICCVKSKKLLKLPAITLLALGFLLFSLLVLYHFFESADISNFPNYTYSTYKINYLGILPLIDLTAILFLTIVLNKIEILLKKNKLNIDLVRIDPELHSLFINRKIIPIQIVFFVVLLVILFYKYQEIYSYNLSGRLAYMLKHPFATTDQKMSLQLDTGHYHDQFYEYVNFIKDRTPEKSRILLPPQESPWQEFGNRGFMRYFLYPRILINGKEQTAPESFKNYDYVIIVLGTKDSDIYRSELNWPQFSVPGKEIYFLEKTGRIQTVMGKYEPSSNFPSRYGLIKL